MFLGSRRTGMGRDLSFGVPGSASSKIEEGARSPFGGSSWGLLASLPFLRASRVLGSRFWRGLRRKGLNEMARCWKGERRRKGRYVDWGRRAVAAETNVSTIRCGSLGIYT